MTIQELDQTYIANTYARFPVVLSTGKGSRIWDEDGKEYIDLATGIAVNTFGIADEDWAGAVTRQLYTLQHTSNLYYTAPCARLAELLCQRTGMKKVFFSNSGAEANECAIKVARKYACDKYGPDRHVILTLDHSFHGRTLTTLAATGQDVFHELFQPLTPGFVTVPVDLAAIEAQVSKGSVAGILFEPVLGEGGVLDLPRDFVQGLRAICDREDIVLMCDEVQTGNGRTGRLYGYMNFDIVPDVVSTAKGLGGGLPLGATLLSEKVQHVLGTGDHGSTFGGNPVCCAGAYSILSRLTDDLLAQVREKSQYIRNELNGAPGVKSISGMGFILGIEPERPLNDVVAACMDQGVLVITAKTKVRLLPALNIPWEDLKQAVGVLKAAFAG